MHTMAAGEMLVERRFKTFSQLIGEYWLASDVALVRSEENRINKLTRVPKKSFKTMKKGE